MIDNVAGLKILGHKRQKTLGRFESSSHREETIPTTGRHPFSPTPHGSKEPNADANQSYPEDARHFPPSAPAVPS